MVQQHGIDAATLLAGGQEEVFAVGSVDELMGKLNDYVGENGCFTALVKSTEILLPLPELQGFEIIDTPGMNDPVPSRTQKTRDYMARCDVVFFLSRCSQFLDQSDMDLLAEQLPAKGVKRMVLVAGQLDGAIADDGFDRASLAETEKNVRTRLARRAENEIEKLAIAREKLGDPQVAALLRNLKTPVLPAPLRTVLHTGTKAAGARACATRTSNWQSWLKMPGAATSSRPRTGIAWATSRR